jgi:dinuclear metal center YbgI/SA1388 family protein
VREAIVRDLIQVMEEWAPPEWAESWDNVGLQVGDPNRPAGRILVALELTGAVVEEAIRRDVNLVVVHHPPIFRLLKSIRFDSFAGQRLERLIKAGIGIYAAHTNLDQAEGGTNDTLAALVGIPNPEVLQPVGEERLMKLVVFVPVGHEEAVRGALASAGAGHIGNYSHCTFQTPGTGTFLPLAGTNPFIGEQGKLEYAQEVRLETILPESKVRRAVAAMLKAHPYEEVAYDLYPLANKGRIRGHGRIGTFAEPQPLGEVAARLKEKLGLEGLSFVGDPKRLVRTIAVGAGAGGSLIPLAIRRGADLLVTGDVKYHDAQDALDAGLAVIDIGHYNSEALIVGPIAKHLRESLAAAGLQAEVLEAQAGRDPFRFLC